MQQAWQRAVTVVVLSSASLASTGCSPANATSAPAKTPSAPALVEATGEDDLDRTLKAEGLLGVLKRIDAHLGNTLDTDKFVDRATPNARAKLTPVSSFDEAPIVTWGVPASRTEDDANAAPTD